MLANLAGLSTEGAAGAATAAEIVFGGFTLAPLLALLAIRRILVLQRGPDRPTMAAC
jgi:hypothetical protein